MFGHLTGDALDKVIQLLQDKVCFEADDSEGCKEGVATWWPTLANIIYSEEAAKYVCNGLSGGACEVFKLT